MAAAPHAAAIAGGPTDRTARGLQGRPEGRGSPAPPAEASSGPFPRSLPGTGARASRSTVREVRACLGTVRRPVAAHMGLGNTDAYGLVTVTLPSGRDLLVATGADDDRLPWGSAAFRVLGACATCRTPPSTDILDASRELAETCLWWCRPQDSV